MKRNVLSIVLYLALLLGLTSCGSAASDAIQIAPALASAANGMMYSPEQAGDAAKAEYESVAAAAQQAAEAAAQAAAAYSSMAADKAVNEAALKAAEEAVAAAQAAAESASKAAAEAYKIFEMMSNGQGAPILIENPFIHTAENQISTFSADVDTASYT